MNNLFIKMIWGMAILSLFLLTGCTNQQFADNSAEWRCSLVECAETVQLNGPQWAQQNCYITEQQGTLCQLVLENGQSQIIPLEQLNLTAITANQCIKYVCVEETLYKKVNYTIDINELD